MSGNNERTLREYFYESGKLQTRCYYNENNRLDGEYTELYENGFTKEKCFYVDGQIVGECSRYFNNGQMREIYSYMNGKREGRYCLYYKNGQLRVESTYVNDYSVRGFKYEKNGMLASRF